MDDGGTGVSKMLLGEAMGRINLDVTDLVAKREEDQQLDNVHRAMIGIGTSPVIRFGRSIRVRQSSLERWLQEQERRSS